MGTLTAVMQRSRTASSTLGGGRTFTQWLDALAQGECDRETLIRGVHEAIGSNADAGWELLALVDQYYRRHRIGAEDFRSLNLRVQSIVMGGVRTAAVGDPTPPPEDPPAAPPSAPAATAPETASTVPRRSIAVNELLRGRYRVQGILGRGGMGTVYAAIDQYRLNNDPGDQNIALKVLHSEVIQRPGLLAELRGEFQSLQSLSHPNIVRVHEFDQDGDLTFFTMERLDGVPLSRMVAEQKSIALYRPYALAMIRQLSAAVAYAHSRGVVHGDLNPSNIFVTESSGIRVLDFGASCRHSAFPSIPPLDGDPRPAVATPTFASCELLEGKEPQASDDVYALGCITYMLLTGEHPFRCRNALAARKARQQPRRPSGLSYRQWRTLKAALSFERRHRPADAQIWWDKLPLPSTPVQLPPLSVLMAEPPRARPMGPWLTCILIALIAGVCWWWAQDRYHLTTDTGGASNSPTQPIAAPQANNPAAARAAKVVPAHAPPAASLTAAPQGAVSAPVPSPSQGPAPAARRQTAAPPSAIPANAELDMDARSIDVPVLQEVASVPVHRRHNYRNGISFTWSTEPGTARPGQDFVPVNSRTEYMPAGDPEARLLVPIVSDPRRTTARTFYVVINSASDGATLGSRTLTMVTIPAAD
jgi:serine/threonine protein kinase